MTTHPDTARRRPGTRAALLALLLGAFALAGVTVGAAPASAHAELVSSTPADGGTVDALPVTAVLTFSEDLDPDAVQIALTDSAGAVTGLPPFTPDGATIDQPLPGGLAAGTWTLAYRVVSSDGHPVGGTISFTVTAAAAGGATGSDATGSDGAGGTGSAASSGGSGAASPLGETSATATTPAPGTLAADVTGGGGNSVVWWVLGAAVVVAVVGVVVLRRRRAARG